MWTRTRVVFLKELLTLVRDRRLVLSAAMVSLLVMPALMGFIGNIDRVTGADDKPLPVLLETADARLESIMGARDDIELFRDRDAIESRARHYLRLSFADGVYTIHTTEVSRRMSQRARELRDALDAERTRLFETALVDRGLSSAELQPFAVELVDSADPGLQASRRLAILIPYLAILLLVSNAVRATYIAVGEKEKRTLASLLVADVPRRAIVLGKTMTIALFTMTTSALLVTGMIGFARLGFTLPVGAETNNITLSVGQALALAANVMALAIMIAALVMLLGTIARSQREAGMYTSPLAIISIGLALMSFSSSEFGVAAYASPILGNALVMKDTLLGTMTASNLTITVAGNLLLAALLVWGSVRVYEREEVMLPA